MTLIEPVEGIYFECSSELEEWRAKTLLTKEPETIAWLDRYLNEGSSKNVLFDVGANIGVYSIYAAAKHKCRVFAFEPVWENFARLEANKSVNGCENLHAFQIAVSAGGSLVDLFLKDARVGNSGAQIHDAVDEVGQRFTPHAVRKVLSVSLDSLVADFGFPCPSLIKIDIDGLEGLVFKGARRTLGLPDLTSILVELNSEASVASTSELLARFGFSRDRSFDALENHSSKRRRQKDSNVAENMIFSRGI